MKNYKTPKNLLSKGSTNSKTAKNEILTYILYLAPHKQNSKISEYLNLKCNWNGCEYTTNIYLETLQNENFAVCVGGNSFEFTNEGIEKAVKYINE